MGILSYLGLVWYNTGVVYDCFSFYNELDLLEIRLNVLKDAVDRVVLVEATKTHTGKPKPLHYEENKGRFSAFHDRIIHIVVDDFPDPPADYDLKKASWMRENFQRNAIMRGLKSAREDDVVIISDLDEIPCPSLIAAASALDGIVALEMEVFAYYLNFKNYTHDRISVARVMRYKVFQDESSFIGLPKDFRGFDARYNVGATPTKARECMPAHRLKNAGWHFSYLGGAKKIVQKVASIAIEYANEHSGSEQWVTSMVAEGADITGCGGRFFAVPLDARFPAYLREHRERYAAFIYVPDKRYYKRTFFPRIESALRGWIRRNGAKLIPRSMKQLLFDKVYCKIVKEPIRI